MPLIDWAYPRQTVGRPVSKALHLTEGNMGMEAWRLGGMFSPSLSYVEVWVYSMGLGCNVGGVLLETNSVGKKVKCTDGMDNESIELRRTIVDMKERTLAECREDFIMKPMPHGWIEWNVAFD